jgi:hypothetical protein
MINKKLINFTDAELMKVEIIKEKEGQRSFSEAVRSCVRQWHDHKFYSKYAEGVIKPLKEELTQEQFCESVGGIPIKKNGIVYGFIKGQGGELDWSHPMSDFKKGYKKLYK